MARAPRPDEILVLIVTAAGGRVQNCCGYAAISQGRVRAQLTMIREEGMTDVEAVVQHYYGDRPVIQRIDDALRALGIDPERPSHRDLWPFDQLHSRGIVATREQAERAGIKPGMQVLDLGCGLGGASRYLAVECGCGAAAIDLTPNFVEAARILTARCGLAARIEFRQANALALPFEDGTFDHVLVLRRHHEHRRQRGAGTRGRASAETGPSLFVQRDRARVGRGPSVSAALGERRGDEFSCGPRGDARRS